MCAEGSERQKEHVLLQCLVSVPAVACFSQQAHSCLASPVPQKIYAERIKLSMCACSVCVCRVCVCALVRVFTVCARVLRECTVGVCVYAMCVYCVCAYVFVFAWCVCARTVWVLCTLCVRACLCSLCVRAL